MRKVFLLATMMLVTGLFAEGMARAAENIPNLQGTWESLPAKNPQHSAEKGYTPHHERTLIIVEGQQGRAFFGHKERFAGGKMVDNEKFSGIIYWDDKTIYVTGHEKGFNICTIESPTEIRGVYIKEGSQARILLLVWKKIK